MATASLNEMDASLPIDAEGRPRRRSAWSRCDEAVARIAPTATTTCQVCSALIAEGEWQVGLMFLHVEGFMLMEWYHVGCTTCVPGVGIDLVLEMVQDALTPTQQAQFEAVCRGVDIPTNALPVLDCASAQAPALTA